MPETNTPTLMNRTAKLLKNKFFWISIAIAIFFASFPLVGLDWIFNTIAQKSLDARFIVRGTAEPSGKVAIAYVDEKSIKAIGRWPWSRSIIAALIQQLNDYGAKTIGFDVLFVDPEMAPQQEKLTKLSDTFVELGLLDDRAESQQYFELLMTEQQIANNDQLMADVMNEGQNVVLGMALLPEAFEKEEFPDYLVAAAYSQFENTDQLEFFDPTIMPGRSLPIPLLASAAGQMGFVNTFADTDGAIRREALVLMHEDAAFAPLGLRVAQVYLGLGHEDVYLHINEKVQLGNITIPIQNDGYAVINYYGSNYTIPSYSIIDILDGTVEPDKIKDKAIIVGGAAVGMADLWPNPFSPAFLGVEKQATIVENILQEAFLEEPDSVYLVCVLEMLFIGLLMGVVLPWISTLWAIPFALACLVCHAVMIQIAFSSYGLVLKFTLPAIQIIAAYVVISAIKYFTEERDKKFLQKTFSSYLAPELIDEMYSAKTHPQLGGEAKLITAYFTDIQSFSTFSEKLTAHQLVELLNDYLSAMTDILINEKGTLDKYEGDAIIAFFGAPLDLPDQELRACRVAVKMQKKLESLCEEWKNQKLYEGEENPNVRNVPPEEWDPVDRWPRIVHNMRMRIGINTGEIVVGNMGSEMRMNYTMMGDPVNLAARLESAAKQYGIFSLVSEYTLDVTYLDEDGVQKTVMDQVEVRFLDRITVVGKAEPVRVYELFAMKGELTEDEARLIALFNEGMEFYLDMQWDKAIEKFTESFTLERYPFEKTNPSEVFIKRSREYKENPPVVKGKTWDGVFRLTSK